MRARERSTSAAATPGAGSADRAVARILELIHGDAQRLSLIEIGPPEPSLRDHVDGADITPLDLDEAEAALRDGAALSGAGALPFHPGFFDYAVAVDALDRLEPALRQPFLSELRRISRRGVILAGPFDSPLVRAADRIVTEAARALGDPAQPLRAWALPSLAESRRLFEAHGDETVVFADGSLPIWTAIGCLSAYGSDLEDEVRQLEAAPRPLRRATRDGGASYRSVLVCTREPSELGQDALDTRGFALEAEPDGGAIAAMLAIPALTAELNRVHRRLAAEESRVVEARAILARREAQVEDLSHRLADSLAALAAERGERELSQREIAAMQKARAWRIMARLYFATARVRHAASAPVRFARDMKRRLRRRLRAL